MYKKLFKRVIDLTLALIGLLFLAPIIILLIIISLIIHKENPFFYQSRPGLNEKIFKIVKFKSMNDKKDKNGKLLPDKDRLTKWGDFLRKSSLDEIPQLINVVKGDMSLVGPRPLRTRYLPFYTEEEKVRHTLRPGITGLAQVSGRNSLGWDEKLAIDIEYVKNISFLLDIKILLKTVKKVFKTNEISIDILEVNALDEYRKNQKSSNTN